MWGRQHCGAVFRWLVEAVEAAGVWGTCVAALHGTWGGPCVWIGRGSVHRRRASPQCGYECVPWASPSERRSTCSMDTCTAFRPCGCVNASSGWRCGRLWRGSEGTRRASLAYVWLRGFPWGYGMWRCNCSRDSKTRFPALSPVEKQKKGCK